MMMLRALSNYLNGEMEDALAVDISNAADELRRKTPEFRVVLASSAWPDAIT